MKKKYLLTNTHREEAPNQYLEHVLSVVRFLSVCERAMNGERKISVPGNDQITYSLDSCRFRNCNKNVRVHTSLLKQTDMDEKKKNNDSMTLTRYSISGLFR